jgi:branched-chain amino acid transport system substrate-binding protein
MSKRNARYLCVTFVAAALAIASAAQAEEKEIVVGLQCDRTGPTQIVGTVLCPGYHDYIALVNSNGGVEGFKIRVVEIDHEYKVPPAMEAHERFKLEGEVLEGVYGTPQIAALTKKLEEDKILGTSPGFGTAAAADGKHYPYVFPIAASYSSQGAAAVQFARKQLGGSLRQEDRIPVLRQPGGQGASGCLGGPLQVGGFRAQDFRGACPWS